MDEPRTSAAAQHFPEIDRLKGLCILLVVCIHAELYEGTALYRFFINRAVMVFLVLFGLTSELWWRRRDDDVAPARARSQWLRGRLRRLVPGYWAMMAVWWLVVALWRRPDDTLVLGWKQALITFAGYSPWVGTSWFVTMILQYVLLLPFLRKAPARFGWFVVLPVAALFTFLSSWWMFYIVDAGKAVLGDNLQWPGFYYHWIFFPRALWHVTAGIFIARVWQGKVSQRATLIAALLTAIGMYVTTIARGMPNDVYGPIRELAVAHLVDVPLAVALLGLFRWLPLPGVGRLLAWFGLWSWGIYLAHLLIHEVIRIGGFKPGDASQGQRVLYALFLLASGVALAFVADRARGLLRRLSLGQGVSRAT